MTQRTDEQLEADEALRQAIKDVIWAYHKNREDMANYVLADYIVITAEVGLNGETAYSQFYLDGDCPLYRALGLLETNKAFLLKSE